MKNKWDKKEIENLTRRAAVMRHRIIEASCRSKASHVGSCLSCVDILSFLYGQVLNLNPEYPNAPDRDRFILSKGHAAAALYAALESKGFFNAALWDDYCRPRGALEEHPGPGTLAGVEAATGSLGHGLSIGTGIALSARILKQSFHTYVLISDGECNEGSVWEAAMFAGGTVLKNLTVVVDFNKWQATGRSCDVTALEPLADKFRAFGWQAVEVDGHDFAALGSAFDADSTGPKAVIAHTVKGRGISFMEDDNNWHYRVPTPEDVARASEELGVG